MCTRNLLIYCSLGIIGTRVGNKILLFQSIVGHINEHTLTHIFRVYNTIIANVYVCACVCMSPRVNMRACVRRVLYVCEYYLHFYQY